MQRAQPEPSQSPRQAACRGPCQSPARAQPEPSQSPRQAACRGPSQSPARAPDRLHAEGPARRAQPEPSQSPARAPDRLHAEGPARAQPEPQTGCMQRALPEPSQSPARAGQLQCISLSSDLTVYRNVQYVKQENIKKIYIYLLFIWRGHLRNLFYVFSQSWVWIVFA
ncbi:hypothetical protein AALO_G00232300 [Alosa alosa]|uniref:Uncharacterized protein n=1 Tax=Alosa alosa TaxID=278164 RepID=A0AAV6G1G2_9TELE|nr:hypothetical protein AALO_G00232300 [Alosa alosa]